VQIDRRTLIAASAALGACPAAGQPLSSPADVTELWPGGAPGGEAVKVVQETAQAANSDGLRDRTVTGITRPTLSRFPTERQARGAALIIPGGGYGRVVVDREGFETARWLAARGVEAHVLLYRLPADGWAAGPDAPLQDAQRALRLIRRRSGTAKLAVIGFSAGGHLAAHLATGFDKPVYPPVDETDRLAARPDLAALLYPVITMQGELAHAGSRSKLLGAGPSAEQLRAYSMETQVTSRTPPTFLAHAADDASVPVANSELMFEALRAAGVTAELHVFEEGGHGFGIRGAAGKPAAAWTQLFLDWAGRHGL
jgi:acetyl esterase/lipase